MSFTLLQVLLVTLWVAGGATRAGVSGHAVVRGVAAVLMGIVVLFGSAPAAAWPRAVTVLLAGALLIPLLQLVPLPPDWWQALPQRAQFAQAIDGAQPWRPLAIVPDATVNALTALLVPVSTLVLLAGLRERERVRLVPLVLVLVAASLLVGLAQLSGVRFDNPFINYEPGRVSGTFANRNHFALLLALGCVIAPAWAVQGKAGQDGAVQGEGHSARWRLPLALAAAILFLMLILATGSRAGVLVGTVGFIAGILLVGGRWGQVMPRAPSWMPLAAGAGAVCVVALFVGLSIAADRAASIDRVARLDAVDDMRLRAFPTVLAIARDYFPAGSGFGAFDPVFRLHEPFALLKPTFFNHAHDDYLEIVLEGGLPALLLAGTAIAWWARASLRAWSSGPGAESVTGKAGSAVLLLVLIASAFDYPARTPLVMAIVVIAAALLDWRPATTGIPSATPARRGAGAPEYI